MLPLLLLLLLLAHARAASVRGRPLVFSDPGNATHGRALSAEDEGKIWYVRSGSAPPPGCVAPEAVAPGVYLARGEASAAFPRGEWTPEMKYDPAMPTAAPPRFPHFGAQVRTDADSFAFQNCATEPAGPGRFYVSCAENRLRELAEDPRVLWIAPTPRMTRHSYESRRLILGQNFAYNGSGARVAVSDTGLDHRHCAFYEGSAPPLGSVSGARQKVVGVLAAPMGDYLAFTGAHGTATAGVAAGYACMDETGVAPLAQLGFVDIDADEGDAYLYPPANLEAYLDALGATVHSASWGAYTGGVYDDWDARFDAMQRSKPKVCQVRSAGNSGPAGVVGATSKNGLVVGACLSRAEAFPTMSPTQRAQQPELYAHTSQIDFSSRGPAADGRLFPQVCAPGFMVRTPYAVSGAFANHADYALADGTSFAAPAIAGVLANLQQRWKAANGGQSPDCALLEAALMAHAVKPTRVVEPVGNRLQEVAGAPAITTLGTPVLDFARWTDVTGLSVASTGRQAVCLENLDSEPWTIVLRWTDVATVAGADAPLINDLDMVLVGASGEVRVANDALNNFERVAGWPAQHTRIVVLAYDGVSTFGAQPFSIHVKGKTRRVSCASALLPSEFAGCAQEGAVSAADSWLGSSSCDFRTCPADTCGADCARTCDLARPCAPALGGSGYYEVGTETCRPASCPEFTFVTDTECACKLGSAAPCGEDQMAACKPDGTFALCAANSNLGGVQVGTSAAAAPALAPPLLLLLPLVLTAIR